MGRRYDFHSFIRVFLISFRALIDIAVKVLKFCCAEGEYPFSVSAIKPEWKRDPVNNIDRIAIASIYGLNDAVSFGIEAVGIFYCTPIRFVKWQIVVEQVQFAPLDHFK